METAEKMKVTAAKTRQKNWIKKMHNKIVEKWLKKLEKTELDEWSKKWTNIIVKDVN